MVIFHSYVSLPEGIFCYKGFRVIPACKVLLGKCTASVAQNIWISLLVTSWATTSHIWTSAAIWIMYLYVYMEVSKNKGTPIAG